MARSIALRPTLARVPLTLAIPAPEPPSPKSRGASPPPAVIKAIWLADQDGRPFHLQERMSRRVLREGYVERSRLVRTAAELRDALRSIRRSVPPHAQEHETIPRELAHEHGVQHGIVFECPAGVDSVTPYALLSE